MKLTRHEAADAPSSPSGYAQAVEISGHQRLVFVSGQIPVAADGSVPEDFTSQARQAWANVRAQLRAADMDVENIVKSTVFLADRRYAPQNRVVRKEVLGAHDPALTVIITGIFDEAWLIEIECVAAA
ncbi:MAG: RidA family protein [Pseudomonadota bacterium]